MQDNNKFIPVSSLLLRKDQSEQQFMSCLQERDKILSSEPANRFSEESHSFFPFQPYQPTLQKTDSFQHQDFFHLQKKPSKPLINNGLPRLLKNASFQSFKVLSPDQELEHE